MGSESGGQDSAGSYSLLKIPKRCIARESPNPFAFVSFRPVTLGCLGHVTRIPIWVVYVTSFPRIWGDLCCKGILVIRVKELGTQWVKMALSSCPSVGSSMGGPNDGDTSTGPFASGLCRMYKRQCRPGVSIWWLNEFAARWISENPGLHEGCDEETQQLVLPGKYVG